MIRSETVDGIVRLVIDRPQRRNAIDSATAQALGDAIEAAQMAPVSRVLVIKGAGDVFSTGRDLRSAADAAAPDGRAVDPFTEDERWVRIFQLLLRSPIPSVAVVRGHAVAGGFTLAMGCDFVLAEASAIFGAFEMRHGFPAAVCTPLLARLVGPRLGLEFAMLGEPIDAGRLYAAGLINRLAADADELAKLEEGFVGRLAMLDPRAVRQTRELFRTAETMPLDQALAVGRQLNQLISATGGFARAGQKLRDRK